MRYSGGVGLGVNDCAYLVAVTDPKLSVRVQTPPVSGKLDEAVNLIGAPNEMRT
jgi:hypothetical protein